VCTVRGKEVEDCAFCNMVTSVGSVTFSALCELVCHLLHTRQMMDFVVSSNFIPRVMSLLFHPIHSLSLSVVRCGFT
jgi:hypothetical protein